jgi:hypothetical protein
MTRLWTSLITLFFLSLTSGQAFGQETDKVHKDSLITIVKQYYDLNLKVFQANSKLSDIDNVFKLFTEDFTYLHPKYGGEYSRENLYNGYIRNQKNGIYNGRIIDIKIVNKIIGINAVVVEKRFIKVTETGKKEGGLEMTLFEFRKGKIFRIFEYW